MKAKTIIATIVGAINSGSRLYNNGDVQGCATLYEATSRQLLNSGLEGFSKIAIEDALQKSSQAAPNEKAWFIRHAFDSIISNSDNINDAKVYTPSDNIETEDLIDFTQCRNDLSKEWYSIHDGVMGGVSTGSVTSSTEGEMIFSGQIRTEYNGGFASIRRSVNFDESSFDGFFIDVKCDDPSRQYAFNIKDNLCVQMGGVNFKHKFTVNNSTSPPSVHRIYFPFEDFQAEFRGRLIDRPPMNTQSIKEVSIMAMKPAGPFTLYVSKIGTYKDRKE